MFWLQGLNLAASASLGPALASAPLLVLALSSRPSFTLVLLLVVAELVPKAALLCEQLAPSGFLNGDPGSFVFLLLMFIIGLTIVGESMFACA